MARFKQIKDSLSLLQKTPARKPGQATPQTLGTARPPKIEHGFFGHELPGIPNDDDMAISNAGMIVSVMNGRIAIHNEAGTMLKSQSLSAFAQTPAVNGFDPHVVYDPAQDRFVVVFLTGNVAASSQIHVAVSASGDPLGNWYTYHLNGNPLNDGTWSDFPAIALSQEELYITCNTFTDGSVQNSGFRQSVIWQLSKQKLFSGQPLTLADTRYHHSIKHNGVALFNLTPVKSSTVAGTLPFYFLSNEAITANQSSKLVLVRLSSPLTSNSAAITIVECSGVTPYTLPPNVRQKNSTYVFDRNDARILQAFLHGERIRFVMNALNASEENPRAGIYYGQITNLQSVTPTVQASLVPEALDAAFPSLVYMGLTETDHAALIVYAHASPSEFPGFSGVFVNSEGEFSAPVRIREGENHVPILGDYTGVSRQFNKPGIAWVQGCAIVGAGPGGGTRQPYLAKIASPNVLSSPSPGYAKSTRIHPNPTSARFTLLFRMEKPAELTVTLHTLEGKLVAVLLKDHVRAGETTFLFSTDSLPAGVYVLSGVTPQKEKVFQQRLVVTR
ncbi:T9SS type A sorting domain-containing protein [Sabulibacter ruber]|uniref:T9SS type A sorting domain-containing protein n=1 Tax=Sabulibacter ruber TaxID=2811901 RepID=UPI001A96BBA9|nr:T9SS type A sorting domain-containing protein [Sabulibacter ruber]